MTQSPPVNLSQAALARIGELYLFAAYSPAPLTWEEVQRHQAAKDQLDALCRAAKQGEAK